MSTKPSATFSTDMDDTTITPENFKFQVYNKEKKKWVSVAHTVEYKADTKTAYISPSSSLRASQKYRVTVTTKVESSSKVALDQNANTSGNQPATWTFTTGTS